MTQKKTEECKKERPFTGLGHRKRLLRGGKRQKAIKFARKRGRIFIGYVATPCHIHGQVVPYFLNQHSYFENGKES